MAVISPLSYCSSVSFIASLSALAEKLLETEVIFKEDLIEIFGKRQWEKEVEETTTLSNEEQSVEDLPEPIESSSEVVPVSASEEDTEMDSSNKETNPEA